MSSSTSSEDINDLPGDGESNSQHIVEVHDATVTFEMERGTSRVLNEATLGIERREILGIVGESGSGKSMFASSLLDAVVDPGVLTGEITYYPEDGDPVDVLDLSREELRRFRWEEISMVFQGAMSSFNPTISIKTHFEETLKAHDADMEKGLERARQLLTEVYLEPDRVLNSYAHELSGGMKQRALIALSLVLEPNVLVMDEPTAALDLLMQRSILKLLRNLQERYDITLIFITHDLPLVAELADRLAVMYAFEFVEIGQTNEVLAGAAHPYTRALLNATPNLDVSVEDMRPIEGSAPDPVNVPTGCSYHPRCPLADETCRSQPPALNAIDDNHSVACFHWEDASEAVPSVEDTSQISSESGLSPASEADAEPDGDVVLTMDDLEVHFSVSSGILDFFGSDETVHAVDGVDLDIYENDVVALVGESGCGKTTLGKAAIGLQRPTGGAIKYRGQDIWDAYELAGDVQIPFKTIRRSLQIIHQDPGGSLNPNRRVIQSLEEPLIQWHPDMSKDERRRFILSMLEKVGMTPPGDYAERYPHQLSGGEKQRTALVRALIMNPDVILADEAISALDVSLRIEMMDLFLELQDDINTSYIFISHDLSNARYLAERAGGRIGVMYMGEIIEIGPVEQIINNPQHPYTKALRWATPDLRTGTKTTEDVPVRSIDIPDPVDPPSGCRFHTRCPEAREICAEESPESTVIADEHSHEVNCFRAFEEHEYWSSPSILEESH